MDLPEHTQVRPAPWDTKVETYWLVLYLKSGVDKEDGVYAPLEFSSPTTSDPQSAGKHCGGLGLIVIVRYLDTPCGPYDELMLVPGAFDVPGKSRTQLRMTRIYVSQKSTMYNGRINWNTPKHLARFQFSSPVVSSSDPHPPSKLEVSVFPPAPTSTTPFFSATIQPFTFPPAVPFQNSWLPSYFAKVVIPPIPSAMSAPAGAWVEEEEQAEAIFAAGSDEWCEFQIRLKTKKARGCWVTMNSPEKDSDEDEKLKKWWPQGHNWKPWVLGLWIEDADLRIEKGIKWKLD